MLRSRLFVAKPMCLEEIYVTFRMIACCYWFLTGVRGKVMFSVLSVRPEGMGVSINDALGAHPMIH